ncbi:MAG TPA: sigma-70 family RNA polymerase sigma factor [Pyrinomonadaceae bacterium]
MKTVSPNEVSQLLADWSNGDRASLDKLMPLVYAELHDIASRYMRRERAGHTLQTTGLVNEAYLKLVDQRNTRWQNRAHFFAIAAQIMRRILVDHARKRRYAKRGAGAHQVSFDEGALACAEIGAELVALDDALNSLASIAPQQSRIVEIRYFGGLTVRETAQVLGLSVDKVKREWTTAKAWLHHEMSNH